MYQSTLLPTPYPPANTVLDLLLSGVRLILGDRLVGLYLYGSLASGDFNPHTSDIDFLAVTEDELSPETITALEAMHARIWASGLKMAAKLEGCYLPRAAIRRFNPEAPPYPSVNEGQFYLGRQGSDWVIQRHILREQGVVLAGPPPRDLIDPVSTAEIKGAVRGVLAEWWAPMLADPGRIRGPDYQAYAILTMCRALYTLQHGDIISKPAAARWAGPALGQPWAGLISDALDWRPGAPFDRLDEVLGLIRLAVEQSHPNGEIS